METMDYDQILVNKEQLDFCISRLSKKITAAYNDFDNLLAVVILEGAKCFAADLFKRMKGRINIDYIKASSYQGGFRSSGKVVIENNIQHTLEGKNVLLIDDIYDSGLTLDAVLRFIKKLKPQSIKTCVLLEKDKPHKKEVPIDFLGLRVENSFLIGYGLDYRGKYRELPFIASLDPRYAEEGESVTMEGIAPIVHPQGA